MDGKTWMARHVFALVAITIRSDGDVAGHSSGVGTVAAVAALAATLFRLQINIHNLLKLL